MPDTTTDRSELALSPTAASALHGSLPHVAGRCVEQIFAEVPEYARTPGPELRETIETAVAAALGGFLRVAAGRRRGDPSPHDVALDGAYRLGAGEALNGRPMDALQSAYRIGARVAWREMAQTAVRVGMDASTTAQFAEVMFAFIEELNAASVEGHASALEQRARTGVRRLERLANALIAGHSEEVLQELIARAEWTPPRRLSVALLPTVRLGDLLSTLGPGTLRVGEEPGDVDGSQRTVLLVSDRRHALRVLRDRPAYLGPSRPWAQAASSYDRVLRALRAGIGDGRAVVDTETHLADLVLAGRPEESADLRARVLAPLGEPGTATHDRLAETLRCWLLLQGRREEVAAALHVHPQTVRYRMGQVREAYGDRLNDPHVVLELLVALN